MTSTSGGSSGGRPDADPAPADCVTLTPWAETTPWNCLVRKTNCVSDTHDHDPMVGDPCMAPGCPHTLAEAERCYAVVELEDYLGPPPRDPQGRSRRRHRWVCHRHAEFGKEK